MARPCHSQAAAPLVALQTISSLWLGSFPSSKFNSRPEIAGLGKSVCQSYLGNGSENMLLWIYAEEEGESQVAVRVSAECFGGDLGRPLVVADYSRHDAAGIPDLQGVPGILRRNRDKHIGGSPSQADSSWNHHHRAKSVGRAKTDLLAHAERNRSRAGPHGNGALGSRARRYPQSNDCPAHPKGQATIYECREATLGRNDPTGRDQLPRKN